MRVLCLLPCPDLVRVRLIQDWQRSISDVGFPGPDGDKGGEFLPLLIVPTAAIAKEPYRATSGSITQELHWTPGVLGDSVSEIPVIFSDCTADAKKALLRAVWRRRKGHYVRRLPVAPQTQLTVRRMCSIMLHNTSCSALLVPGSSSIAPHDASPP